MRVKICGLRSRGDVAAAAAAGAAYAGFVFFDRSTRNLSLADARWIAGELPDGIDKVALTVDAEDAALEAIIEALPVDVLQLHGSETPDRVAAVRDRFGLPVLKAVGLACEDDLALLDSYSAVADQILVDARPMPDAEVPGGNGLAFDWRLLQGRSWTRPWMLAGGLTAENVADAVRLTGAEQVDVSSGVERAPGLKDHDRIAAFVRAARGAD
jgi:phosphoribosylanthranilate isomerase